jgi:hypothetical protein
MTYFGMTIGSWHGAMASTSGVGQQGSDGQATIVRGRDLRCNQLFKLEAGAGADELQPDAAR